VSDELKHVTDDAALEAGGESADSAAQTGLPESSQTDEADSLESDSKGSETAASLDNPSAVSAEAEPLAEDLAAQNPSDSEDSEAESGAAESDAAETSHDVDSEATVSSKIEPEEISVGHAGGQTEKLEGHEEDDGPVVMDWYILKVQSNRERSIAAALRRKIAVEGLDEYFGDVIVPVEKVTEFKGGKKKVVERKLYPGYIVVQMCINDNTWFAVRETSGIGDFTGSGGKPTPMLTHEVARIIHKEKEDRGESPKLNIQFQLEDRVKIKEGTFEGFEGDVSEIDQTSGRVTVMINIFGRSTPVELEYWQIERV
jgi:transcription termination/antitermination protein NusG